MDSWLRIILGLNFLLSINSKPDKLQLNEENIVASKVNLYFIQLFLQCYETTMPEQKYLIDNIPDFILSPSRTTVGLAKRYTGNRKFFANMIATPEFNKMLTEDVNKLRQDLIKKLRYCEKVVMDKEMLKEFYEKEVDPANQ